MTIELWTLEGSGHSPEFHDLWAALFSWVQDVEQYRITGKSVVLPPAGLFERPVGTRARPARLYAPANYSRAEAVPLVMLLHGFGGEAEGIDAYLGLRRQIETERFALLMPDGGSTRPAIAIGAVCPVPTAGMKRTLPTSPTSSPKRAAISTSTGPT